MKERTYFEAVPLHQSSDKINVVRAIFFDIPNEVKLGVIKRWATERQLRESCKVGGCHHCKARSASERKGGRIMHMGVNTGIAIPICCSGAKNPLLANTSATLEHLKSRHYISHRMDHWPNKISFAKNNAKDQNH